jgi:putative oxygen-independent coproporphyrinogen III oxidase
MRLPPLSLYIHLPWCERKCPYCDFNSHETGTLPEARYIDALLHDLEDDLPLVQGRAVQTLFIGGGTPSLFSGQAIRRLLAGIDSLVSLSPGLEATMEANPGSAEAGRFAQFREAGINRLSLGVQSFHDASLGALGRIHSSDQARAAVEFARAAGFASLNLDLMHGLPGQTVEDAELDLRAAIACRPAHLSWYQLTIEPNTLFHKQPPRLPVEDTLAEIQQAGEKLLADAGYRQYEVSAYSQRGFSCRHNLNYWTFGDYLAIGAGAHGKISFPDGRIRRYAKRRQPEHYLQSPRGEYTASSHEVATRDIAGEFMLNALRLNEGFSLDLFSERTGLARDSLAPGLDDCLRADLLELSGDIIRATGLGRRFLDSVIARFFP